jgi:FkbM family methyltransferase
MNTYVYLGNNRGLAVLHNGLRIYFDTRDRGLAPHLALYGEWERAIEDVVHRSIPAGTTVVEVGANFGYHTLHMAAAVGPSGKVITCEANEHLCELLTDSIELNGFRDRVSLRNCAGWSESGTKYLVADPQRVGGGHLVDEPPTDIFGLDSFAVKTVRIDDLVDRADFIRIDAEGSELRILKGAERVLHSNPNIQICMEWSVSMMGQYADVGEGVQWLAGMGFRFFRIGGDRSISEVDDPGSLGHCELFVCRH